jgi:hypothetical protein
MAFNGLLDNVVAMWPLNNSFGDSLDVYASGGGGVAYPLTHEAGATISITGFFTPGLAKSFSTGTFNRMKFDDSSGQVFAAGDNDFTIMVWVSSFRGSNNPYLAKWPSDGTNNSWILFNRTTLPGHRFTISSDGSATETIVEILNPDAVGGGSFYQLVIAGYDSVTEEIWMSLDGGAKVRVAHSGGAFAGGNSELTIGWFATLFGDHDQDESAYWNTQLSDAKIQSIWNGGAGLRMTEWDATIPEQDGSNILLDLQSYFNGYEASGQQRVDLHSSSNTMSEAGAGAPIDQGIGLPAIAKTTASVDFSSNDASPEFLEKTSPVGMGGGTDSFTVAAFVEFNHNISDIQGIIGRWVNTGDQRQFTLIVEAQPEAFLQFLVTSLGTNASITSARALEDFTAQNPAGNQTRYIVAWYDGDLNTTNIQLSNGIVVTTAGPSTIFNSSSPFHVGNVEVGTDEPLVGQVAFWGYWRRVLTQPERTFLFNFFGGQPYEALVAADSSGAGAVDSSAQWFWSGRRQRRRASGLILP